jgi:hypothetical protein
MSVPADRLPIRTLVAPIVALGTDLALHGTVALSRCRS